jgi:hypothetical protein
LLIGCICTAVSLASTAFGDTTLYIQSTSAGIGKGPNHYAGDVNCTLPTPTDLLNNYNHVQVVFNAPSGYAFRHGGGDVVAYVVYGFPMDEDAVDLFENSTITFTGTASPITFGKSDVTENDNVYNSGSPVDPGRRHIVVDQVLSFGGPVEFTSFTLQWKVDPDPNYPNLSLANFYSAGFVAFSSPFSIVPIPEPSVAALALLGVTGFGVLRARRTPGCRGQVDNRSH